MASAKQLTANRQNAQKSSGPRTLRGKSLAKMNALKHGMRAAQILIPGEDEREFVDLRQRLFEDLQAEGALEIELFHGIVVDFWRLRRLRMVEAGLFIDNMDSSSVSDLPLSGDADDDAQLQKDLGGAFGCSYAHKAFSSLSRYEASLTRSIHRAINKLLELQAQRRELQAVNDENEGNGSDRLPPPANQT